MTAVTLGVGVVLATWVAAPASPTSAPVAASSDVLAVIDSLAPLADELEQETTRLRARMAVVVDPPVARRDPFTFGTAKRTPPLTPVVTSAEPSVESAPPAPDISWPVLAAIMSGANDTSFTAVLAVGDAVEFVDAGHTLTDFTVISIGAASLELRHEPTKTVKTFLLR